MKQALSKDEQPFGFTLEDVDSLRNMRSYHVDEPDTIEWMAGLADRIEALLPPEDK